MATTSDSLADSLEMMRLRDPETLAAVAESETYQFRSTPFSPGIKEFTYFVDPVAARPPIAEGYLLVGYRKCSQACQR